MKLPRRKDLHHFIFRRLLRQPDKMIINSRVHPHAMINKTAFIENATIGENVEVGEFAWINNSILEGNIRIGRYTSVNGPNTDIFALIHKVTIGNFTSIARSVSIQEFNHRVDRPASSFILKKVFSAPMEREVYSKGDIEIGSDVWIGAQCVVLSGCRIGHGAVVAANSVVNGEVPPYAIVAGSPAKVIRYRFPPHIIDELMTIKWWDWPVERIKLNEAFFSAPLSEETMRGII